MSANTIKFEIVTPEKIVLKEYIVRATIPTKSGEVTILPNHIPLVSILQAGLIEVEKADGSLDVIALTGGFLEVLSDKIVILADRARRAANLDEKEVEEALRKAEKAKLDAHHLDDVEFADISAKLEVELLKTKAISRWRKIKNLDK